ncbi:MAG TPA: argininosuccinate lyase [Acidimicrobiales bacterium]|nr:argininosuccinate lyase [Acidimicrobiales bacterium]
MTLWQGRFGASKQSDELLAFTESLTFDRRLAPDDIACSRAHVLGLHRAGLLTEEESGSLLAALATVESELAEGSFVFKPGDEDVHTAVERRVTELAGEVGARLQTGRSRNDQVATDLRLFTKRALGEVARGAIALQEVLLARAREAGDAYLPGYTHLQRAQPVLLAHHLLAHGWALARDVDRLAATRRRMDVSPLGAGALAGSSFALDPDWVARELGFSSRFDNSIDAVSDRDFVAETLFDLALLGTHLSRIGEEVALWSSEEFGFVHLDDAYATGSSMMPHKKNPDIAELARGKTGRLIGHATGFLTTLKGLPLAYDRDLQEDKEPLFDALDTTERALDALSGLLATAVFDTQAMAFAADTPVLAATDLAEWLVQKGMPFRHAHELVGALVRDSLQRRVPLPELVAAHPALGSDAVALLEPGVAVSRRTTPGGAGPGPVAVQLERFAAVLRADAERFGRDQAGTTAGRRG